MTLSAGREAYVTLCTNSVYAPGALALGSSLRQTGTQRDLVVIVTESLPAYYRYDNDFGPVGYSNARYI